MSTDAHYDARSYDILTNFPVNHEYRWLILNRGLIVGKKTWRDSTHKEVRFRSYWVHLQ